MIASSHFDLCSAQHRRDTDRAEADEKRTSLKVLLVDDDAAKARALQSGLQLLGHECRVAGDGREALDMHRAEHPDVIVAAARLPTMSGWELCRNVRASDGLDTYTHLVLVISSDDGPLTTMQGDVDDYALQPVDVAWLQHRLSSYAHVHAILRAQAEQNAKLRREVLHSGRLARVDALTGIRNRLRMDEDIAVLWAQAKRHPRRYCAALCDIDWFKSYNDAFGHLAGDDVLRRVAQTIRVGLRRGDTVYRYGGEEFLLLLPEESAADAVHAMDRVRHRVERLAIPTPAGKGVVTISIGVAPLVPSDTHPQEWLASADRALYAAKAKGRNRVESAEQTSSHAA